MTPKRRFVLSILFLLLSLCAASAFAGGDIVVVRDWDGVEISNGGWYPFGAGGANVPDTRRFRIYNSGTTNLIIDNPTTFLSGNGFTMIASPVGTIHAGESTTFRVQFLASAPGDYYGTITFNTNDEDEDPYVIHLWGAVNAAPAPEIAVFRNWDDVPVPDGGSFTFPDVVAGSPDSRRFRITNTGTAPLTIANPATLVSGPCFSEIETPVTPIAAGASGWFRVRILCNSPGTYSGTVSIQSNDADEGSYDFSVSGKVVPPPGPDIAVFRNWDNVAVPDGGSFAFPDPVVAGTSDSRRFRITNTGTAPLNIANAATLVSGPCFHEIETPATPIAAGASGWVRVRILCNTPGTYSGTVSIQSDDADENPYDFTVTGTVVPPGPEVPEIALYQDNTAVPDGGSYAYPNAVPTGQAEPRTFRIENSGTATLTLTNPNSLVSGTCFSQTGPPPASSIAPGTSTTFTVQVQCSTAGTKTGAITIQSNDGDENPYNVALQAVVGIVDFNVSVTPVSNRLRRGTSIRAVVNLTGASGFNSDVALSATGLPSGTTATFQPATIRPGQSSTMTIRAGNTGPFGDYSIHVKGTAGGVTHEATATLRVTDPNALPTISTIQPQKIPAGQTTTVVLTGTNFNGSTVTVGGGTDRAFPTITVANISADGKRMEVQVNATDPAVLHHYALYVKNFHGEDGINFRVVPPGPVIDYWSPSEASGGTYAMDVVGVNLQGAAVITPGGVSVFDVDSSDDEFLSAFLKVDGGSSGPVDVTIRGRDGVDKTIRVDIREQRSEIQQKTSVMTTSQGEPLFYVQELKARPDLIPPALAKSPMSANSFGFEICAHWGRTRSIGRVWSRTWFKNPLTGQWGPFGDELLANLTVGGVRLLETSTFQRWFYLEFSLNFQVCFSDDSGFDWDVEACISGGFGFHIPIVGGVSVEFEACLGSPSSYEIDLKGTGFLSFINFHREGTTGGEPEPLQCTRFTDLDPTSGSGERTFEVELLGCCVENVGVGWSGEFYLGDMAVKSQHVGTTQPVQQGPGACLNLQFSTTQPNAPYKTVDPYAIPNARIGILAGDSLHFRAEPQLNANQYSWGGVASGNGQEKLVQLNSPGDYEVSVTAQGTTRTARITVLPVPAPPNELGYFKEHPVWGGGGRIAAGLAKQWAIDTFGVDTVGNGRGDAAKHAYWNCIMVKDPTMGPEAALGVSNAHEREGYENGDPHNTHVMDLENNARAIAFSLELQSWTQCAQRVIHAVESGELNIIVPGANPGGTSLIVPSNLGKTAALDLCVAPTIDMQPVSRSTTSGQPTRLSVSAGGGGTLSYQWYEGASGDITRPVPDGTDSELTVVPTATTSYWVRISATCGATDSQAAIVTVCDPTQILAPPQDEVVVIGNTATLTVTATGGGPLSYQWYEGTTGTTTNPVGTDSPSFTTPQIFDARSYWVRVTDLCGAPRSVDSPTATVTAVTQIARRQIAANTVNSLTSITTNWPRPTQAGSLLVAVMSSAHTAAVGAFSVPAGWQQAVGYEWNHLKSVIYYYPNNPGGRTSETFATAGFRDSVLQLIEYVGATASPLDVVAFDGDNLPRSGAISTGTTQWMTQPKAVLVSAFSTLSLANIANPTDSFVELDERAAYQDLTAAVHERMVDAVGNYGHGANIDTAAEWLGMIATFKSIDDCLTAPVVTTQPASTLINATQSATLSVGATGDGLAYQWYQGASGTVTSPVAGANGSSLVVTPSATTSYWARVSNACGSANSNAATVTVCSPPAIATHPLSQSVTSGFAATLSVTPSGSGPFSYQWYEGVSGTTTTPIAGATSSTYTTPALTASKSYWVRVTSSCNGTVSVNSNTANITVATATSIARRQLAANTANSQTSITTNWTQPTQAGSLLIAVLSAQHGAAVGNFTAPAGWQVANTSEWNNLKTTIYYYPNNPGGRTSETFSVVSFRELVLQLIEYTGAMAAPLDKVAANGENAPSGGLVSTGTTATTSQPKELIITALSTMAQATFTSPTNGFVKLDERSVLSLLTAAVHERIVSAAGAYGHTANASADAQWIGAVATFRSLDLCSAAPTISTQPASRSIDSGQTTTLSVTATTSGGTLSYQWYEGASGVTTTPVGTNSASFTTPALTAAKSYWVRVSNECGNVASNAATVTVCTPPAIGTHPAPVTINSGQTATLSVTATGSGPLTYQWYEGASGVTTTPVGTNSSSFTTPALTATKSYWVRVTSSCNGTQSVNSTAATVTVCAPASITTQPASPSINSGQTATLTVVASGSALSYQWYEGVSGTTTTPVGTNSASFATPALTSSKSYWVRVTSSCNGTQSVNSNTATVTVCNATGISTQPVSQTINSGQTATLTVVASGSAPFTYQWYEGASGTTTTPVGTNSASFTTPALTVTKSYWVKVTGGCGFANSNAATITVTPVLARRQLAANAVLSQLNITTNWTQPTQAGTLLVAVVSAERMTYPIANWQPPAGWQLAVSYEMARVKTSIYYYPNNPGGRTAETFGSGGYYDEMVLQLAEYTGVVTASPLDKTAFNGDNANTGYVDTGYTAQTTQAKELVITGLTSYSATNFSAPSGGFVELDDRSPEYSPLTAAMHEKFVTTAGSWGHSAQVADPAQWVGVVATFKAQ